MRQRDAAMIVLYDAGPDPQNPELGLSQFSFTEVYGEAIGSGYIQVHHLRPMAKRGARYKVNPLRDLRPVCPNCHAMIHRREPPYTIKELKAMMRAAKAAAES